MQVCKWIRNSAVGLASAGLLTSPIQLVGQQPHRVTGSPQEVQLLDVALESGNVLRGFTVDQAGQAAGSMHVMLLQHQEVVASGISDKSGQFAIGDISGGVYQLASGERVVTIRCWAPETAPPNAKATALLPIDNAQRGQIHPGMCALGNPWVVAGIAAAAIAIPIAIKANSDNRQNGS